MNKTPHLLKRGSLFAMFCLSYLPLFFLIGTRIILSKYDHFDFVGFNWNGIQVFIVEFGFLLILAILSIYSVFGTIMTFNQIEKKLSNAHPIIVKSIEPKNEESLSYLATYVIPLLSSENFKAFEYIMFAVLFIMYYKLYSSSSLILVNPILNIWYGLYSIEYVHTQKTNEVKRALIISKQKWIEEGEKLYITKLSHRLYFAYKNN